jgi:hypothetical protein
MPLNDQLLQIIRTSETTWDVKSVLPVSFATLLLPEETGVKDQIKLRKYLTYHTVCMNFSTRSVVVLHLDISSSTKLYYRVTS